MTLFAFYWTAGDFALRRYNTGVKFLVISDIHANWIALQTVLKNAEGEYDQIICCGDLVGYNARPEQVCAWVQTHCASVIRGNHDKAAATGDNLEWFNEVARRAAQWTASVLQPEQLEYLRTLRQGPVQLEHFQIWHGSPRDEDEYVTNASDATSCFPSFEGQLGFFGHTHVQGGFFRRGARAGTIPSIGREYRDGTLQLENDWQYMVNPGSVGQPRDGDPRAAYVLYEPAQKLVTFRRVEYDIQAAAEEVRQAGLPDVLALRLFEGL